MKRDTIKWLVVVCAVFSCIVALLALSQARRLIDTVAVHRSPVAAFTSVPRLALSTRSPVMPTEPRAERTMPHTMARPTNTTWPPTRVLPTFTPVPPTRVPPMISPSPSIFQDTQSGVTGQIALIWRQEQYENDQLWVINSDGTNLRRLTHSPGQAFSPVWSPDGKWIAFGCTPESGADGICIIRPDGTNLKPLLESQHSVSPSSWSPDGRSIAYTGYVEDTAREQVFVMKADGTQQRQVTSLGNNHDASWSLDGRFLVFASDRDAKLDDSSSSWMREANVEIYKMKADGSDQTRLSYTTYSNIHPRFSPDGQSIVYEVFRYHFRSIYAMNADGSNPHHLGQSVGYSPSWSPDARKIAFVGESDEGYSDAIDVMNSDGTNAHNIMPKLMHSDGTGEDRILKDVSYIAAAVWSPQ